MTGPVGSGPGARAGRRAWLAAPLALALLAGLVATGSGPAAADDVGAPTVTVSSMEPLEFRPDQAVVVRGVASAGREGIEGRVVVSRTPARLDTRSAVDLWQQASPTAPGPPPARSGPAATVEVAAIPLDPVPPGESRPFELTIPAGGLQLPSRLRAAGAYGLTVEIRDVTGASVATERGFAVWSPDLGIEPTTVVPVLRLPTLQPDLDTGFADPAELEAATSPGGSLRTALDVATTLPGAWTVDPMIAASAARTRAGPRTRTWLTDLGRARRDHELLVQPWALPDPDLLAASGRAGELLSLAERVAEQPFRAVDPERPDPDEEAPDTGRLVAYRMAVGLPVDDVRHDVAVVDAETAATGLAVLAGADRTVVVPDTVVPLADELSYTPAGRADLETPAGPLTALVADAALGDRLAASLAGDPLDATAVLADLATITMQRPSDPRTVGVVVEGLDTGDVPAAEAVATALGSSPWAQVGAVTSWIGTAPPDVARLPPPSTAPGPAAPGAEAAVDGLFDALATVESLEAATPDTTGYAGTHERRAASAVARDVADVDELAERLRQTSAGLVRGVRIVPGSSITLAADEASIPVTVVNELDDDVALTLQARSRSPRVRVTDAEVAVVVEGGGRVRVDVPVRAVSNGPATVTLRLLAPDSTTWGPTVDTDVRVATVAEAGVLAVVATLAAGLFGFGAWRTIRRGRRRRARMTP